MKKKLTAPAPAHVAIHGDGCTPVQRVVRFPHEWDLVESEWDEETGAAMHTYERTVLTGSDPHELGIPVVEVLKVAAPQPQGRRHIGWRWHDGTRTRSHDKEGRPQHY